MKQNYACPHRPGNPLEYPDEVATIDKILCGDFFPKDLLQRPREYFPDYGNYPGTEETLSLLRKAQGNPEMTLTIYRGAPSEGHLNQGDWVTLNKRYAEQFAGNGAHSDNPNSKVYSYTVKAKELSFDGDSFYEFGYWGKSLKS